jgi:hypothetical protein
MKELTPRQILDAVRESLDEAALRIARQQRRKTAEVSSSGEPDASNIEPASPDSRKA